MQSLPVFLLLTAQIGLGMVMGAKFILGARNRPAMIGAHFLLGAIALEVAALLLRGAPNGAVAGARSFLQLSAGLLAGALLLGIAAALFGKSMPTAARVSIYGHAALGVAAYGALILWMAKL
jgi:hypothetical protein